MPRLGTKYDSPAQRDRPKNRGERRFRSVDGYRWPSAAKNPSPPRTLASCAPCSKATRPVCAAPASALRTRPYRASCPATATGDRSMCLPRLRLGMAGCGEGNVSGMTRLDVRMDAWPARRKRLHTDNSGTCIRETGGQKWGAAVVEAGIRRVWCCIAERRRCWREPPQGRREQSLFSKVLLGDNRRMMALSTGPRSK